MFLCRVSKKYKGGGKPTGIGNINFTLEQATRVQRASIGRVILFL